MQLPDSAQRLPILYIDTPELFAGCISDLQQQSEIAFDLEFDNNRYRYGFHLCLIQVATPSTCYIIDPIIIRDISALFAVFEDAGILKIVHCPGEDLRLLHSLSCFPQNLFDTEVCAKLLNFEASSLSALLAGIFDHTMDKKLQTSNWHKRPLTEEQVRYSALDVLFLHKLKNHLYEMAAHKGLLPYLQDEQDYLSQVKYIPEKKEIFLTKADLASLSPYDQYVLNELLKFRDGLGAKFNMPSAHVVSNQLIRQVARAEVDLTRWADIPGLFSGVKTEAVGMKLLEVYTLALNAAEAQNLSRTLVRTRWYDDLDSNGEKIDRKVMDELKQTYLYPIHQELSRRYGEHAVKFMFGEGLMNDLVRNKIKFNDIRGNARKKIIKEIAQIFSINIDIFI